MRPLRLSMTAFGPFATTEAIDFRDLGASRLFLIHGETGAGKSTILDALCAALYGESAGGERTPGQLRSDHAAPETPTVLELDFAIGPEAYRIERRPEQLRPKKKGEGYTREAETATLWRLAGPERGASPVAVLAERKVGEVRRRVIELLGFEAAQFRQVVVLPQGQFRRLLSASSEEREAIFAKLFETAVFSAVERELKQRAAELRRQAQRAVDERRGRLSAEGASSLEELTAKIEGSEAALRYLEAEERGAGAEHERRRAALTEAEVLEERFAEWEAARAERAALEADAPAVEADRARRDRARRAGELEPAYAACRRAGDERARRSGEEARAREELARREAELVAIAERARYAAAEHARGRERLEEKARLARQLEQATAWAARRAERAERERAAETAREEGRRCAEAERAARERLERERGRIAELGDPGALEAEARARVVELEARLRDREALATLQGELGQAKRERAGAEAACALARSARDAAAEESRRVQAAVDAGRASLLARTLAPGEPCPVCGSTSHPRPAPVGEDLPSEARRREVEREREATAARCTEAERALAGAEGLARAKEEAAQALGGRLGALAAVDVVTARGELEAARVLVHEGARRGEEKRSLEAALTAVGAELEAASRRRAEAESATAAAEATLEAARREEAAAAAGLGPEPPAIEALEARIAELERALGAAEEAHRRAEEEHRAAELAREKAASESTAAAEERAKAEAAGREAEGAFAEALARGGFPDRGAFETARLVPEALASLERRIDEHEQALARVQGRLGEHERAISGRARPALGALQRELEAARSAHERAREACLKVREAQARARRARDDIARELAASRALEERLAVVGQLAEVADGANPRRLSLHRFVLSVFLDDVLAVATQHLRHASRGRYDLVRREEVGDRRSGQGLDLDVFDHHTGERRAVATLSGGEGFLAALALALGLADVVQSYAGGIRLETVFVDEGFGSLDPETLDLAVETLLALQAGGRLVGVISHVAELRERIDVRLEVEKGDVGSRTRFHVPV